MTCTLGHRDPLYELLTLRVYHWQKGNTAQDMTSCAALAILALPVLLAGV